jgi:hypothetical protein
MKKKEIWPLWLQEIINYYKKFYESKEGCDVKIYAGEKPNIKNFMFIRSH